MQANRPLRNSIFRMLIEQTFCKSVAVANFAKFAYFAQYQEINGIEIKQILDLWSALMLVLASSGTSKFQLPTKLHV